MRKILPLILIVIGSTNILNAQTEKKDPPPPPAPEMKTAKLIPPKVAEERIQLPPVITVRGKLADDFYQRNPTVKEISRQENIITIKKKDGGIERYNMSKKEDEKTFTEKYGTSPIPPPPPAPKKIS